MNQLFCVSHVNVVILPQDSLEIKFQNCILNFFKSSYSKVTPNCTSRLPIFGLNDPQTKRDTLFGSLTRHVRKTQGS